MKQIIEASQHARLSASSAERWLNCPGSVNLAASHPTPPTSFAAAQGTYAHNIAASCLKFGYKPDDFIGQSGLVEGHTVTCDEEMVEGIELYLKTIAELRLDKEWIELSLDKALQFLDPDFGGTADYATYSPSKRLLRVLDFKYGAGVYVAVNNNKQLKKYALGTMLSLEDIPGQLVEFVEVYIVQPRYEGAQPVRCEKFDAFDLMDFIGELVEAARETRKPDAPLNPGPWCAKTFCPNAHVCPALEHMQHALVRAEFNDVIPYDPKTLGQALAAFSLVEERIKAVREFAYNQALSGVKIPGWKLVDKKPRRQWTDPNAVIAWAKGRAVDPFKEPELKSPAQLEKLVKGPEKKAIAEWCAAVSSGTTLVPESDMRQEVTKAIIPDDFDVIGSPGSFEITSSADLFK